MPLLAARPAPIREDSKARAVACDAGEHQQSAAQRGLAERRGAEGQRLPEGLVFGRRIFLCGFDGDLLRQPLHKGCKEHNHGKGQGPG